MGNFLSEGTAPLLLYIGGFAAFLASAFWRPEIGLYYIVPLLPLQTTRYRLHNWPLGAQWIDLMLLGVVIGLIRHKESIFPRVGIRKWIVIFAILTYVSLWQGALFLGLPMPVWFDDQRLSDWKNYTVIFLLFFLVLAAIKNVKQMQILLVLICLSTLALNRNYINTARQRDFSSFSYQIRDEGTMGYAGVNGLAALEAQMSAFLLALYSVHKHRKARIGYLVLLATCLVALTYTLSRGGYMAVLVAAAFIGFVGNRKLLPILAIFLLSWQLIVPNAVRERVFMTQDSNGELDSSAGDRVTLWENAMEIIRSNPAIGTGFDTYKFMHAVGPYEDTHNYYVKVLLETGILGIGIFFIIVSQMFRAGLALYRNRQADDFLRGIGLGVAALLVAAIVGNFFGDRWSYIEETGFTWVFVAMALRGTMLTQEQPAVAEASASGTAALPLAYAQPSEKPLVAPTPSTSR